MIHDTNPTDTHCDPADVFIAEGLMNLCDGPGDRDWEELEDEDDELPEDDEERDQFRSDAEADGDALASIGWGTDEDYGCFCGGDE